MSGAGTVCDVEVVGDGDGPMSVIVRGDLDDASAARLEAALDRVARHHRREVVVDLAATGFLDSAGLSVLVDYARGLRERDAELVLQTPSRIVTTVLELTSTRGLFRIRSA